MTYIQPNKNNSLWNGLIAVLGIAALGGIFFLVTLYNSTVNLSHNIAAVKTELDAVSAQDTGLNNTIIAALDGNKVAAFAQANGLVEEKNPQYFSTGLSENL